MGIDSNDGDLRIFSYAKMDNGDIFEMGFKLEDCFLCKIKEFCENDSKLPFIEYIGLYNFQKVPLTKRFKDFDFSKLGTDINDDSEIGFFKRYDLRIFNKNVFGNFKLQWFILVEYNFYDLFYIILFFIAIFTFNFVFLVIKNRKTNEIIYNDLNYLHKISDNMTKDTFSELFSKIKTSEIDEIKDVLISSKEEIQANTQELQSNNEELENAYKNIEQSYNNLNIVLDVFSNLSNYNFDERDYLKKIIRFTNNYITESNYVAILVKSPTSVVDGYYFYYKNESFEENYFKNDMKIEDLCTGDSIYNLLDIKNKNHKRIKHHVDESKNKFCYPIKIDSKIIGYIFIGFGEKNSFDEELINQIITIFKSYYLIKKYTLEETNLKMRILKVISKTLDFYDSYTKGHSDNVAIFSFRIADQMNLDSKTLDKIYWAGILHDVGKIFVSQSTLNKNGKLTDEEYEEIKKHPEKSYELISSVEGLEEYAEIVRYHHERYDGKGYPTGIAKEKIPIESRILTVADSMDAMLSDRPYKKAKNLEEALQELEENKGSQFDPQIVDIAKQIDWNI
jgi:polar amino acid transport system substrate-binding protein